MPEYKRRPQNPILDANDPEPAPPPVGMRFPRPFVSHLQINRFRVFPDQPLTGTPAQAFLAFEGAVARNLEKSGLPACYGDMPSRYQAHNELQHVVATADPAAADHLGRQVASALILCLTDSGCPFFSHCLAVTTLQISRDATAKPPTGPSPSQ